MHSSPACDNILSHFAESSADIRFRYETRTDRGISVTATIALTHSSSSGAIRFSHLSDASPAYLLLV